MKGVRVFMEEPFGLLEECELPKPILVVDTNDKEITEKGSRSKACLSSGVFILYVEVALGLS